MKWQDCYKKVRNFFNKPKNIVWSIIAITALITFLVFSLIYTQDSPEIIPEETRKDVRSGIKEFVAEPLKSVSEPLGNALVEASFDYQKEDPSDDQAGDSSEGNDATDPTADWPVYRNSDLDVTMKYPLGWQSFEGEKGNFSFAPDEDSYESVTFYYYEFGDESIAEWWEEKNKDSSIETELDTIKKIGKFEVYIYREKEGMEQIYYVFRNNDYIFNVLPSGSGYDYVEKVIASIN